MNFYTGSSESYKTGFGTGNIKVENEFFEIFLTGSKKSPSGDTWKYLKDSLGKLLLDSDGKQLLVRR